MKKSKLFKNLYRKKTMKRISSKCKLLGFKSKLDPIVFLNLRTLFTAIIFSLLIIYRSDGFITAPVCSILFYILFEYIVLDYRIKIRTNKLNNEALFYFQVLVLALESGRNLKTALELTSENIDSEISEEFKKSLNNVKLGKSFSEAITDMKERIPSEEINTVLLNITQSTIFGNNIVDSLNNQIDYLRDKKLLSIKAEINKMPMKISVISVFFIIPIVLMLVLGPVLITYLLK